MKLSKTLKLVTLAGASLCAMAVPASAEPISIAIVTTIGITQASAWFATAVAVTNFVIGAALNVGLSLIGSAVLGTKPEGPKGSMAQVQIGAEVPRQIIFGRGALPGRPVYIKGIGTKNKTVQAVYALCDWECDSLEKVWVDGVEKSLTTVATVGTEHIRYQVDGMSGRVFIKFFRGTMTQAADSNLVAQMATDGLKIGDWTVNHRLAGVCYATVTYLFDTDDLPALPQIVFQLKGAKLYDWRKDSTNGGSGAHRWNDPTTWEWSGNPAVHDYNFRRGFYRNGIRVLGMGVPASDLLHDLYTAAANICDEVVNDGGTNKPRYTCGVIVSDDAEWRVACDAFRMAMGGDTVERAGQFGVIAGAAYSPVMTITDDDLKAKAPAIFARKVSRDNLYNSVRVSFLNTALRWDKDSLSPLVNAGYEAEDGNERLTRELDLGMVYEPYQARRLGSILLEQSRMQATHTGVYPAKFSALEPGDWVTRNFNRSGRGTYTMKVLKVRELPNDWYEITMQQCTSGVFVAPVGTIPVTQVPVITPAANTVDPPGTPALSETVAINPDGTVTSTFAATWTASADAKSYVIGIKEGAAAEVERNVGELLTYRWRVTPGVTYQVRVRAIDLDGRSSAWSATASSAPSGDVVAPGVPSGLAAAGFLAAIMLTWTNPADKDLAGTEIWEASVNNFASATKRATVAAPLSMWSRDNLPTATTRYYWIRSIDRTGNVSAKHPTSDTAGVAGTTLGVTADIVDTTPPGVPTALYLDSQNALAADQTTVTKLLAAWPKVSDTDIGFYELGVTEIGRATAPFHRKDFVSGVEGSTFTNATSSVSGGVLTVTATTADPMFTLNTGSFAGVTHTLVRARIRRISGTAWEGICYYQTSGHGFTNSFRKQIPDPIPQNGEWVTVEWDMTALTPGGTDWTDNTILNVRLDLGNAIGVAYEVDWVEVGGTTVAAGNEVIFAAGLSGNTLERFEWPSVTPNTEFRVRLRSVDKLGNRSAFTSSVDVLSARDFDAPSAVSFTAATGGFKSIWLDWSDAGDADLAFYELYEHTASSPAPTAATAATFRSLASKFVRDGLPNGATRWYWVRSVDTSGNRSAWSASTSVSTAKLVPDDLDTTPPAVPTGLALSSSPYVAPDGSTFTKLIATWSKVADTDLAYYEIGLTEQGGTEVVFQIGASGSATERNEWPAVRPNVQYTARIRAVDVFTNKSAFSTGVNHTTARDTTAPGTPTGLSATAGLKSIWLTWTANTEADLDHYDIYEHTASSPAPVAGTAPTFQTRATALNRDGLAQGVQRWYWIRAVDTSGNASAWTASVNATTASVVPGDLDTTPPAVPTGLALSSSASVGSDGSVITKLVATWAKVADTDLAYYEIGLTETGGTEVVFQVGATGSATERQEWPSVRQNVQYTARIRAVDTFENTSAWSTGVNHTTARDTVAPAVPTGLSAAAGFELVWLTWAANTEADLSHYEVYQHTASTPVPGAGTTATYRSGSTQLAVTGLTAGTQLWFWIRAVDTSGNRSAWTSAVTATPTKVELGKIADGAVNTATFAAGIVPVEIVAVLPATGNFAGRTAYLTTDGKIYRHNGTAWTRDVDGNDLVAGSVVAGKIAAGAVSATEIAANAIIASKLAVTDVTNNVLDPTFADQVYWQTIGLGWDLVNTDAAALAALSNNVVLKSPVGDGSVGATAPNLVVRNAASYMPVEAGKEYRLLCDIFTLSGFSGFARLEILWYQNDKVTLASPGSNAVGSADFRVTAAASNNTYNLSTEFTAPANAAWARFRAIVYWSGTLPKAGAAYFSRPAFRKMANGELIVDGAITSAKLTTGELITLSAQIKDGIITNAKVANLDAAKLTAGTALAGSITVDGKALATAAPEAVVDNFSTISDPGTGTRRAWTKISGTGAGSVVADASSATGSGYALEITGTSDTRFLSPDLIPFDPTKLYRVRFRIKRISGSLGNFYLGVVGYAANGTTFVNSAGSNLLSNQYFFCASNDPQSGISNTTWVEYVGYIKGVSATPPTTEAPTADAASPLHTNVRFFRGHIIANIATGDCVLRVDSFTVDVLTDEAAAIVNGGTTQILPGKILIDGGTSLADWRQGGDLTKIAGGAISANTVDANKLTVGLRNVKVEGIEFEHNSPGANQVSWTAGTIRYYNDAGALTSASISAGNATWTTGVLYVYWVQGAATLSTTTTAATAFGSNAVVLASYRGTTDLVTDIGRTIIDGSKIKTGSIDAQRIAANAIIASKIAIGDFSNLISDPNYADDGGYWTRDAGWTIGATLAANLNVVQTLATPAGNGTITQATSSTSAAANQYFGADGGKSYRLSARTRVTAGFTGRLSVAIEWYDRNNTLVGTSTVTFPDYRTVAAASATTTTSDNRFTAPVTAVSGRFRHLVDWSTTLSNAGNGYFGQPTVNRAVIGELIVDGSIITDHMTVNTINGDRIQTNTLSAEKILAGTVLSNTVTVSGTALGTTTSNAASAFSGTAKYRTAGAPTNNPTPTSISATTQNSNGTINIRLDWGAYTQGANQADFLLLFWRKDGSAPTVNDACLSFSVNTSAASYFIFEGVNPADTYSFGIAAARRTENGLEIGTIQAPTAAPDWRGVNPGTPNFTANINGVAAASVQSNAADAFSGTAKYRAAGAPTNNPVPAGTAATVTLNNNGTANIRLDWDAYTQGTNQADLLIIFWRKAGTAPTINDASFSFNVNTSAPGYYVFEGVNPEDTYSFGIAAARRTESGLEIGTIQAPTSAPDWRGITGGSAVIGGTTQIGSTLATLVESRANDPAARINAATTQIDPGKILISTGVSLADWRQGGDQTRIAGGQISANTIDANKLTVGLRNIKIEGLEFEHNAPATNQVSWSTGTIRYYDNAGVLQSAAITAGNATWTTGTLFIYWTQGATTLSTTTAAATAFASNAVVLSTYRGGTDLVTDIGRTIIDGGKIKTQTITATQVAVNGLSASRVAIGDFSNLINDTGYFDTDYWQFDAGWVASNAGGPQMDVARTVTTPTGNGSMSQGSTEVTVKAGQYFTVDGGKWYRVSSRARALAGFTGLLQAGIQFFDRTGASVAVSRVDLCDYRTVAAAAATNHEATARFQAPAAAVTGRFHQRVVWSSAINNASSAYLALPTVNRAVMGSLIVDGEIVTDHMTSNSINGDRIQANTLDAAKILAGTVLSNTVTVSGTALGTIESRAANPAAQVNAASTQIDPGKILISGATSLANWRQGGDETKIAGGAISANTVDANKLTVGLRNIKVEGLEFEHNAPANNQVSWTAGTIRYYNDAGTLTSAAISASNATWSSGVLYVYWVQGATSLTTTTTAATAFGANNVVLATYRGGTDLVTDIGRTIIDGGKIKADTIDALQIKASAITAPKVAAGAITASKLTLVDTTNMILDPELKDASYWTFQADWGFSTDAVATVFTALNSPSVVKKTTTGAVGQAQTSWVQPAASYIAINPNMEYLIELDTFVTTGWNGYLRLSMQCYRGDKVATGSAKLINGTDHRTSPAGANTLGVISGLMRPTLDIPANAQYIRWNLVAQFPAGSASAGAGYAARPRIIRKSNASLIVDGAITADHLAADSVTADKIDVANLQAINADLGAITAGTLTGSSGMIVSLNGNFIRSGNFNSSTLTGFELDGATGYIKAYGGEFQGVTSNKFPFEASFGLLQDGLFSDESSANVSLPYSAHGLHRPGTAGTGYGGNSYHEIFGTIKRTPTAIEYNLQITYNRDAGVIYYLTLAAPRAPGISFAPVSVITHQQSSNTPDWDESCSIVIDQNGDIWDVYSSNAGPHAATWGATRDDPLKLASTINPTDLDPQFLGTYANTVVHVWKHVLMNGIRRIRVPATVTVSGTPTPVVRMRVWMWGAAGQWGSGNRGGPGGYVKFEHAVTPGEILSLLVGAYNGEGFGGVSPNFVAGNNQKAAHPNTNHGGGGSYLWRGPTKRANLLAVAGGGGAGSRGGFGGVGGSAAFGGGNGATGSEMNVCLGLTTFANTGMGGGSGGGGYVGGGLLSTGRTDLAEPGKGGTNFIIGTATNTTNSSSVTSNEDANGRSNGTVTQGTTEQVYIDNKTMTWSRADVGCPSTTAGRAGPGMIAIQWLTS